MSSHHRIRVARRQSRLSQAQLAAVVGVQRSAVSHWEAAEGKNPSVAHMRQVAMALGVQFEWLATGRGAMPLSRETALDSVATAKALLVDDPLESRLLLAFREAPTRSRVSLVEVVEQLALQRTGRARKQTVEGDIAAEA